MAAQAADFWPLLTRFARRPKTIAEPRDHCCLSFQKPGTKWETSFGVFVSFRALNCSQNFGLIRMFRVCLQPYKIRIRKSPASLCQRSFDRSSGGSSTTARIGLKTGILENG